MLAFVFASALALVPLLMAIVAIPITLLAVLGLTAITDVSFIVVFLVSLIGLGIAIDYALIVVMRWREERERGLSNEDAIRAAVATSGRAVVFSGTTVAIGLLAALVLPIPFLQSMAYGGLLIPLVSVAVALTMLPVVLATVGPRADRRRLRRTERAERHWASWARAVIRHRVIAVVSGIAVLVALIAVAGGIILGDPEADSLGGSGEPKAGLQALERSGIGASPLTPIEVIAPADEADRTAAALAEADGVRAASAPQSPEWTSDGRSVIEVITTSDTNSTEGRDAVGAVRDAAAGLPGVGVGGTTALQIDWVDDVYGSFPLMLGLISLITFVLLARAFRSLVLPAKAIAMNLLSVFATWGVVTLVWQEGFLTNALFGVDPTGSVAFWAPMIIFAFIYGLSMDYEVFILARMREEYERTGSTERGGRARDRQHRTAGHQRGADRVPRLRLDGDGRRPRREGARHRARCRRAARRPRRALAARAGDGLVAGSMELVDAGSGPAPAAPARGSSPPRARANLAPPLESGNAKGPRSAGAFRFSRIASSRRPRASRQASRRPTGAPARAPRGGAPAPA